MPVALTPFGEPCLCGSEPCIEPCPGCGMSSCLCDDNARFKTEAASALAELLTEPPCKFCGDPMDMSGYCQEGCIGLDERGFGI